MKRLFKINWKCTCTGETLFTFFLVTCLFMGLAELTIGVVLHCIRFNLFVTDEWFTEFFAVTCGVLVTVISSIGFVIQSSDNNIQKKYQQYSYALLVPVFYQGLSCLVFSLPVLYRDINETLPEHIIGSQIHRPTYERIIYIRVMMTINVISLSHLFINIIFWGFTVCHSNSMELEEKEINSHVQHHIQERGKFANTKKTIY